MATNGQVEISRERRVGGAKLPVHLQPDLAVSSSSAQEQAGSRKLPVGVRLRSSEEDDLVVKTIHHSD